MVVKILLAGANGFVGSRFYREYRGQFEIVPLSHSQLDIAGEEAVLQLCNLHKPQMIINCAAISNTMRCANDPDLSMEVNVTGAVNLAKGAASVGASYMHLSSDQVYNGSASEGPYDEEEKLTPAYTYGQHKLLAEEQIQEILSENWCLRLTWLFGMPERRCRTNPNILMNSLHNIMKRQVSYENVKEKRGMTYVGDLIDQMVKIMDIPYGIYNAGAENHLNRFETYQMIYDALGYKGLGKELIKPKLHQIQDLRMDMEKIKGQGIHFLSTENGIKRCIKEYGLV